MKTRNFLDVIENRKGKDDEGKKYVWWNMWKEEEKKQERNRRDEESNSLDGKGITGPVNGYRFDFFFSQNVWPLFSFFSPNLKQNEWARRKGRESK